MAQQVNKFQSNSGAIFDTLYDALKDELREYFANAIGNDPIAKKLIDHIGGDMPGFFHIVRDMEKARTDGKLDRVIAPPQPAEAPLTPEQQRMHEDIMQRSQVVE